MNSRVTVKAQRFPHYFLFGAGTSAAQCEGASNVDGRKPSNLDNIAAWVNHAVDGELGPNSYHYWKSDIYAISNMSVRLEYENFNILIN